MIKVVGIGAGGHTKVVIEILRLAGSWKIVALLDANAELWGKEVLGAPVLGSDDLLMELHQKGVGHAFIGLGTVGKVGPRRRLYEKARDAGFQIVAAIHLRATIAPLKGLPNPYGDGHAAERIVGRLAKLEDLPGLLRKKFFWNMTPSVGVGSGT